MAIYKNTPPISIDGLILYLDAANPQSYVSGSTTWRDISGNNNLVPISSSIYNSSPSPTLYKSGSSLINNYTITPTTTGSQNLTIEMVFYWTGVDLSSSYSAFGSDGGPSNIISFYKNANQGSSDLLWWLFYWDNPTGSLQGNTVSFNTVPYVRNRYNHSIVSISSTGRFTLCVNGQIVRDQIVSNFGAWRVPMTRFSLGNNGLNWGQSIFKLYLQHLPPDKMIQNYNATKARFGL